MALGPLSITKPGMILVQMQRNHELWSSNFESLLKRWSPGATSKMKISQCTPL